MGLAVVIPAYNEAGRIGDSIKRIQQVFPQALIIVSDDGSWDATVPEAREGKAVVVEAPFNRGKGAAVQAGVLEALRYGGWRFLLFTDCDLSCPPEEWVQLLKPLEQGRGVVAVASRWLPQSRVEGRTHWRTLASLSFARLARILTGLDFKDFQCGCKAFTREAARILFSQPLACPRFAFDVEVLLRASHSELPVVEVPVYWRAGERSSVKLLKHSLEMFSSLLQLRRLYNRKEPGHVPEESPRRQF